jgi:general secretion pathway protein L
MSAQDLLDADVSSLGRQLGVGWRWWLGELAEMIPERWRRAFTGRPALCAEQAADGGYRFSREGRPAIAPPRSEARTPVVLLLSREQVLVRRTETPPLSRSDVRRLLTLELDRLTPFRPEDVYAAVASRPAAGSDARRPACLAVVRRETADAAIAHARASGLEPMAVGVAGAEGLETSLDFLPQTGETAAGGARGRRYVWGAIAMLLAANMAAAILRDEANLDRLRDQARAQRPALQAALKLRRQVKDEDARRGRILRARAWNDPLRTIDAATRALPDGAWVQRMSWNGQALRLAGYKREGVDVLAALRGSPAFAQVRDSTGDTPARLAAGEPFDVTADVAEPRQ